MSPDARICNKEKPEKNLSKAISKNHTRRNAPDCDIILRALLFLVCTHCSLAGAKEASDIDCNALSGQVLVVPPPADQHNFNSSRAVSYFDRIDPAAIFMSQADYRGSGRANENTRAIRTYHNALRSAAANAQTRPIYILVDFESAHNSLRLAGVPGPLAAMTLSATADTALVREYGLATGALLRSLDVDGILGPVLDLESNMSERPSMGFGNRTFGDDPASVHAYANAYMLGLSDTGTIVVAKHFPGYGSIDGTTERIRAVPARSRASQIELQSEIIPFRKSADRIDGFLTSHLHYPNLEINAPATVSRQILNLARGIDHQSIKALPHRAGLLMTDDISEMGGAIQYMIEHNIGYGKLAEMALEAGHNLILIGNRVPGKSHGGKLRAAGLWDGERHVAELVHEHFLQLCKTSPSFRRTLTERANEVLAHKSKAIADVRLPYGGSDGQYYLDYRPLGRRLSARTQTTADPVENYAIKRREVASRATVASQRCARTDGPCRNARIPFHFIHTSPSASFGESIESAAQEFDSAEVHQILNFSEGINRVGELAKRKGEVLVFVLLEGQGRADIINLAEKAVSVRRRLGDSNSAYIVILLQASPKWLSPELIDYSDGFLGNFSSDSDAVRAAIARMSSSSTIHGLEHVPVSVRWGISLPRARPVPAPLLSDNSVASSILTFDQALGAYMKNESLLMQETARRKQLEIDAEKERGAWIIMIRALGAMMVLFAAQGSINTIRELYNFNALIGKTGWQTMVEAILAGLSSKALRTNWAPLTFGAGGMALLLAPVEWHMLVARLLTSSFPAGN